MDAHKDFSLDPGDVLYLTCTVPTRCFDACRDRKTGVAVFQKLACGASLSDRGRATVTHLYNYCIRDGYESGKVYKNGDAGIIADKERGPGNYSVAMVRDDAAKTTTYEALFAPDSFGFEQFEIGQQFGFGVCVWFWFWRWP